MTRIPLYLIVLVLLTSCSLFETGEFVETDLIVVHQSDPIKQQNIECEEHCHVKSGLKKKLCQKKCDIKRKRAEAKVTSKSHPIENSFWTEVLSFFKVILGVEDKPG